MPNNNAPLGSMSFEIELKAWVEDPSSLKATIDRLCVYNGEFSKDDAYWNPPDSAAFPAPSLRMRQEQWTDSSGNTSSKTLVTYKAKERRGSLEVNLEQEFEVSNSATFKGLLSLLKFNIGISKQKNGWSWKYGSNNPLESKDANAMQDITVELSQVASLGWFLELEILSPDRDEDTVKDAQGRLLQLLGLLGIGASRIESRYYAELLQEKKNGSNPL